MEAEILDPGVSARMLPRQEFETRRVRSCRIGKTEGGDPALLHLEENTMEDLSNSKDMQDMLDNQQKLHQDLFETGFRMGNRIAESKITIFHSGFMFGAFVMFIFLSFIFSYVPKS